MARLPRMMARLPRMMARLPRMMARLSRMSSILIRMLSWPLIISGFIARPIMPTIPRIRWNPIFPPIVVIWTFIISIRQVIRRFESPILINVVPVVSVVSIISGIPGEWIGLINFTFLLDCFFKKSLFLFILCVNPCLLTVFNGMVKLCLLE